MMNSITQLLNVNQLLAGKSVASAAITGGVTSFFAVALASGIFVAYQALMSKLKPLEFLEKISDKIDDQIMTLDAQIEKLKANPATNKIGTDLQVQVNTLVDHKLEHLQKIKELIKV